MNRRLVWGAIVVAALCGGCADHSPKGSWSSGPEDQMKTMTEGRKAAAAKNKGEGRELSDEWTNYADGRVLSGTEAQKLGFVDQLGNFEDAVKRAKTIGGIVPTGQGFSEVPAGADYDNDGFIDLFVTATPGIGGRVSPFVHPVL